MRTRLCLAAVLLACAAPRPEPPRGAEVLRIDGQVENAPFRFGRDDLPALPRRAFEARAPARARPQRFEGIALETLLADKMEVKREADTAVVHGEGGVAVPVPLPLIRMMRPVLADHVDGVAVASPGAAPAPLSLAWPSADHPGIDSDPRFRWWWVSAVRTITVERWVEGYGRALRVPAGASDEARHGADVLGAQCIGCHRIRGRGGTRGPDLTAGAAAAVLLRSHPGALRDHLRKVGGSGDAPTLSPATVGEVAAFLDAVVRAGPEPPEPRLEPEPREELPSPAPRLPGAPADRR